MHMIVFQCFKCAKSRTMSAMHDLRSMYEMTLEPAAEVLRNDADANGNFQLYPRRAWMSDSHGMALVIAAESACIDSENWLFSKLRTDN